MAEKINFEASIEGLEKIVVRLEKGDTPLDEAMGLFEDGVKLARKCSALLDKAEQKVALLLKDAEGNVETKPFEEAE